MTTLQYVLCKQWEVEQPRYGDFQKNGGDTYKMDDNTSGYLIPPSFTSFIVSWSVLCHTNLGMGLCGRMKKILKNGFFTPVATSSLPVFFFYTQLVCALPLFMLAYMEMEVPAVQVFNKRQEIQHKNGDIAQLRYGYDQQNRGDINKMGFNFAGCLNPPSFMSFILSWSVLCLFLWYDIWKCNCLLLKFLL